MSLAFSDPYDYARLGRMTGSTQSNARASVESPIEAQGTAARQARPAKHPGLVRVTANQVLADGEPKPFVFSPPPEKRRM